jgi:hypothetical protein
MYGGTVFNLVHKILNAELAVRILIYDFSILSINISGTGILK